MLLRIIIINIFLGISIHTYSQNVFNKVYNDYSYVYERSFDTTFYYNNEAILYIQPTLDGGILNIGTSFTNSILFGDSILKYVFLVKTNSQGDTIWTNRNNISNYFNYIRSGYQYSDSSFVLFGSTEYANQDTFLASMIFVDKNGNYKNHYTFNLNGNTEFNKVKTTDNGLTFDIIGDVNIDPNGSGNVNTFLVKIDSSGNILNQFYGMDYGQLEFFYDLEYDEDSAIYISGIVPIENIQGIVSDYYIIKLDKNYNLLWEFTYDNGGYEIVGTEESLIYEPDGLVFCGWSGTNNNDIKARVTKLDFNGNFIWEYASEEKRVFNGYKVIRKTNDGHYIAAGETGDPNISPNHRSRALLSKVSNTGELIWTRIISKYWGTDSYDYLYDLQIAPDGGFLLAGYQISSGIQTNGIFHRNDGWLCKTDSCGFTTGAQPQALLTVDSVVGTTVYITNLSEEYCTAKLLLGNGDSLNIYAYSQWTNGDDPAQLTYTFTDTGNYNVTLYTYAGDGIDSFSTQVEVKDTMTSLSSPPLGELEGAISVYPNPAKDYIILQTTVPFTSGEGLGMGLHSENEFTGEIYTITGQKVHEFTINPKLLQQKISLPDLNNGVYFLKIKTKNYTLATERISVVKQL